MDKNKGEDENDDMVVLLEQLSLKRKCSDKLNLNMAPSETGAASSALNQVTKKVRCKVLAPQTEPNEHAQQKCKRVPPMHASTHQSASPRKKEPLPLIPLHKHSCLWKTSWICYKSWKMKWLIRR
eukprot:12464343-Ditylum_brightwellii.AAC.1